MKFYIFLLFFAFGILQNSFGMGAELNAEVPESLLTPWNEKNAKQDSLIAYKDGEKFRYAQLHGKMKENEYSIITALFNDGRRSHGRVVSGSILRLVNQ